MLFTGTLMLEQLCVIEWFDNTLQQLYYLMHISVQSLVQPWFKNWHCWITCAALSKNHILTEYGLSWNTTTLNLTDKQSPFPPQGTGAASFDEFGNSKYQNRRTMSSSDRAMLNAFKEISTMADRINLPRNIIVSS